MRCSLVLALWCAACTSADVPGAADAAPAGVGTPPAANANDSVGAAGATPGGTPSVTAPPFGGPTTVAVSDAGAAPSQTQSPAPASQAEPRCLAKRAYSHPARGWRCEQSESYAQGSGYERVDGATSVDQCLDACSARPDCSAVSDYLALRPAAVCYLIRSDCEALSKPGFAEEDGGRTHRKRCDPQGVCEFEELADNYGCGEEWTYGEKLERAQSLDDCLDACRADPSCTAVRDYFYLQQVPGCYLDVASCDAPEMDYQEGSLYLKCDPGNDE